MVPAALRRRVEIHRKKILALIQGAHEEPGRHAQIGARERSIPGPRHADIEVVALAQQQEPAFAACNRERRFHHRRQHVIGREGGLKRARHFQHRPQLPKVGSARKFGRHRQLVLLGRDGQVAQREHNLVGVRKTEFDPVGSPQLPLLHPLAVDENPVAALEVLDHIVPRLEPYLGVMAGGAAVAQYEFVVSMAPHTERQRIQPRLSLRARGVLYREQCRRRRYAPGRFGRRHLTPSTVPFLRDRGDQRGKPTPQLLPSPVRAAPGNGRSIRRLRFGPQNLKPEMRFDLPPKPVQRLAVKLFHFSAPQADDMRVLLLHPRFVIVLVALVVHQVQLVHQLTFLKHLEGSVDGDPVDLRIELLGPLIELFGVQVLPGLVDQLEKDQPLTREPDPPLLQRP